MISTHELTQPARSVFHEHRRWESGMGAGEQNPYPQFQCTWGVWQYIQDHFGVAMPSMPGNATDWVPDAKSKGWTVNDQPTKNTVCCWSNQKYSPYGHVAFVTDATGGDLQNIGGSGTSISFTVDEYNFNVSLGHGTRTIKAGSKEADGIEGFIVVPGVSAGTQIGGPSWGQALGITNPWTELSAGLQQVEKDAQQQIQSAFQRAVAAGQIGIGGAVLLGGVWFTQKALRDGSPAARGAVSSLPGKLRRRGNVAENPQIARDVQSGVSRQSQRAVKGAQQAVLGGGGDIEVAVRRKIAAGQLPQMTAAEASWMQQHPELVRAAFQAAPTRGGGRVTAAGRTRVLTK